MIKKLEVRHLIPGMYMSQLDRPWFETPFLSHHFLIKTLKQIERIRQYCSYVYIDTDKGENLPEGVSAEESEKAIEAEMQTKLVEKPDKQVIFSPPLDGILIAKEIEAAKEIRATSKEVISNVLDDVRMGKSVDVKGTKEAVGGLIDSILREKDALMCLSLIKNKDEYTSIHSMNVSIISLAFGHYLGLTKEELTHLGTGALLHDVGKMKIPDSILNKPDNLSDKEYEIVKGHVDCGVDILKSTPGISMEALRVPMEHHERYDGKGYPRGLKGKKISVFGLITSIVDVYDAITTDRVYHKGMTPHDALRKMYEWCRGNSDFHMGFLEKFIKSMGIYPLGSIVEMNTGDVGVVVSVNRQQILKPQIILVLKGDTTAFHPFKLIDMAHDKTVFSGDDWVIKAVLKPGTHNIDSMEVLRKYGLL